MKSKIYTGKIMHKRSTPLENHFIYPIYMYAFDVDEFEEMNNWFPMFGFNRFGVSSIHEKDYLIPGKQSIKEKLSKIFQDNKIYKPIKSAIMLTSARYFNYIFNPVSFHFCYSEDKKLEGIVVEVNNTYGEKHPYLLTEKDLISEGKESKFRTDKHFHVSPFNKIEGSYEFTFSDLKDKLKIRIDLFKDSRKIMSAVLNAKGEELTRKNLLKTIMKYPMTPHLSIPRIYMNAFRLVRKKLTFNNKPVPVSPVTQSRKPGIMERMYLRIFKKAFDKIDKGKLEVILPDKTKLFFGIDDGKNAKMEIKEYSFFPRVIKGSQIGFGEAFMFGEWDSPDLTGLLKLLIINRDNFSEGNLFTSFFRRILEKNAHKKRSNNLENAKRNIAEHYDLSNEFYELFLDEKMIYSSGMFKDGEETLEQAQINKMDKFLEMAEVKAHHHILEIGCGWGGFAVYAAEKTGCKVTGITLSKEQYKKAVKRVEERGLKDKVNIVLKDYRNMEGSFDRIVSIEMIEAVGHEYLKEFFRKCDSLLKDGGKMAFQSITVPDERYKTYLNESDWIQKYIFPGGHLPSFQILKEAINETASLLVYSKDTIGKDYAVTLEHWRERFLDKIDEVKKMGFDDVFIRKWIYYLASCEAGFQTSIIDNIQVALKKEVKNHD